MRGVLHSNQESKIYADGRTYDNKLYTFKECDYSTVWLSLDVMAKKLDLSLSVQNLPNPSVNQFKNQDLRYSVKQRLNQDG